MKNKTHQAKSAPLFCDAVKIAQVMGVSKPSPLNWFKSGKLQAVQFGKTVRFPIKETAAALGIEPSALLPTPASEGGQA